MNAPRLFALGSLIFQDSNVGRIRYADTKSLWQSLHQQYSTYLTFSPNDVVARAMGEHLTKLSEVVGIGCGLAALTAQFAVNVNRLSRFTPVGSGRRVDFEFYSNGQRFFHETKGTTIPKRVAKLRHDILNQKADTTAHCRKRGNGPRLTACTASIVLYQHTTRTGFASHVSLIDPPPDESGRKPNEADELTSVLRHYRTFFEVTHVSPTGGGKVGLFTWLTEVIRMLEDGNRPPTVAPAGLIALGRVREPGVPVSEFAGTIFDARTADRSVLQFQTFDEATDGIKRPTTFIGVSDVVTRLIAECRWDDLLAYSHPGTTTQDDASEAPDVFESGVLARSLKFDPGFEDAARSIFRTLRRRAVAQGRTRP